KVENYLRWSATGAKDRELVFTSGNPGSTSRLNTYTHLEYRRDYGLPFTIKLLESQRKALQEYSAKGEEKARRAQEDMFGIENSLKAFIGEIGGLRDKAIMAKKLQQEQKLRSQIAANPKMKKEYEDAWDQIAKGRKSLVAYFRDFSLIENGAGFNS